MMESQLLPPDLLSCDEDASPGSQQINDQMSSLNSDSTAASNRCSVKVTRDQAPESRKQVGAQAIFPEGVRVSSFEPFCPADRQNTLSEFPFALAKEAANVTEAQDEANNGMTKYNSIFSECLFS